jgi:hypothetical protein
MAGGQYRFASRVDSGGRLLRWGRAIVRRGHYCLVVRVKWLGDPQVVELCTAKAARDQTEPRPSLGLRLHSVSLCPVISLLRDLPLLRLLLLHRGATRPSAVRALDQVHPASLDLRRWEMRGRERGRARAQRRWTAERGAARRCWSPLRRHRRLLSLCRRPAGDFSARALRLVCVYDNAEAASSPSSRSSLAAEQHTSTMHLRRELELISGLKYMIYCLRVGPAACAAPFTRVISLGSLKPHQPTVN